MVMLYKFFFLLLLKLFFVIHNSTTLNRQDEDKGNQYRSIILSLSKEQEKIAYQVKNEITKAKI